MSNPLETTFELLAQTRNPAAVDLLVAALDSGDEKIQTLAVEALLKRRPTPGIVALVRRFPELSPPARTHIEKVGTVLGRGLRDCLLNDDAGLRSNAIDLVRRLKDYAEVPTLIGLLQMQILPQRAEVEEVVFELINDLYDQMKFSREGDELGAFLPESDRIRHQMLATLESAGYRYAVHRCRHVIEGLLILADPENMHLKKFLRDASDEVRGVAAELLCSSRHPGVMALVVGSMTQNYPFPAAYSAIEKRSDPEFVCYLLRNWPRKLTPFQQKNLREIRSVAWLEPDCLQLDFIPAALHHSLIAFLMTTGLPQQQKLAVLEWMVRHGSPEGRLAATDVLVEMEDDKVQEVVIDSLESEEPDVQAWATSQLRAWAIPNAMELLVERLDSPMTEVREAARCELAGFDIHRAVELFDQLDPRTLIEVGKLVQKIDPNAIAKLNDELQNAMRRKRIRAARAALAMKLHLQVVDSLLVMARDSDNQVRRTAAEVLGKVPSREARAMLVELTRDPSPRVRETAIAGLHEQHDRQETAGDLPHAAATVPGPETAV